MKGGINGYPEGRAPYRGKALGILVLDMKAPLIRPTWEMPMYNFLVRFKVLETVPSD
jgi:hypothetical protein